MRHRFIILTLVLSLCGKIWAYDFSAQNSDGKWLYYNIKSKNECQVTYRTDGDPKRNNYDYRDDIVIPSTVEYNGRIFDVTSIGSYAFAGEDITSIIIGNNVKVIEGSAIAQCEKLAKITVPNSVTKIGSVIGCPSLQTVEFESLESILGLEMEGSFSIWENVKHVVIAGEETENIVVPDGISKINNSVFSGCNALKSVFIPSTVESIGDRAFYGCTGIDSIIIDPGITSIGKYAFSNCSHLKSITFPNTVLDLGEGVMKDCRELRSVHIGNGVSEIRTSSFEGCYELDDLYIGTGVTKIWDYAFRYCSNSRFKTITFPNSVETIMWSAFEGCESVEKISLGSGIKTIDRNAFKGCISLCDMNLPGGVTEIGVSAFEGCKNLNRINIPNTVVTIGNNAFSGCKGLTNVTIGNGIKNFGENVFRYCSSIDTVRVSSITPLKIPQNTFAYAGKYIISSLEVPQGAIQRYETADVWKDFIEIYEYTSDNSETAITVPQKCVAPVIEYRNGVLSFSSETEDCEFVSSIKVSDAITSVTNSINLSGAYEISVFATKQGFINSETTKKTISILVPSDTIKQEVFVRDTIWTTVHDTVYYEKAIVDTVLVEIPTTILDTLLIEVPTLIYDTIFVESHDTITNEIPIEVSEPVISIEDDIVSITCDEGDMIIFTTNGDDPVIGVDPIYTQPFTLESNCTIKAIAVRSSPISTENYIPSSIDNNEMAVSKYYVSPNGTVSTVSHKGVNVVILDYGNGSTVVTKEYRK